MRAFSALLVACLLYLLCGSLAGAHAFLDQAQPAVGSTIHGCPAVVKLWLTRHIRGGESSVKVYDLEGKEVDQGDSKVSSDDPTLLTVSVPHLSPGIYKVVWIATCFDTHTTHGSFTFTVD